MQSKSFVASILTLLLSVMTVGVYGQEKQKKQLTEREIEINKCIRHVLELCPVEKDWSRVEGGSLQLVKKPIRGSFGSIAIFTESEKSTWLYFPVVDRPYTKEDVAGLRLTAFALDKNNKVAKAKTFTPVRWASNKTATAITMLEFQVDLSNLKFIPIEDTVPEGVDPRSKDPVVLLFLEKRKKGTAKVKVSEQVKSKKQDAKDSDDEKLIESEANALEQHPNTLWLAPPKPVNSFESKIITSNNEFIGHVVFRRFGERVNCVAAGLIKQDAQGFPRLVLTDFDGKSILNRGGTAVIRAEHDGKKTKIFTIWTQVKNPPKCGTVGVADGRSR